MESTTTVPTLPSAQIVGKEFVHQYYAMLKNAPEHLHRFYSHNSSFVHGGMDGRPDEQAVTGQAEIHKKVMSLNFKNCNTRICQVDCQSSVGGSVVIQVIGELSNNFQPMRQFVQSFVLAPQAAKKYYVHIDIFRYQDIYSSTADSTGAELADEYVEESEAVMSLSVGQMPVENENIVEQQYVAETSAELREPADESVDDTRGNVVCDATDDASVPSQDNSMPSSQASKPLETDSECKDVVPVNNKSVTEAKEVVLQVPPEKEPSKPMTWAAMASRNAASASPAVVSDGVSVRSTPSTSAQSNSDTGTTPKNSSWTASAQSSERDERAAVNGRPLVNGVGSGNRDDKRATSAGVYPDNQQVFIGNLPQYLTDHDLIDFFEQFGKVLDFRINRKSGVSVSGNNLGQKNFGFMIFESLDTVQKVLAERPIYLRKHRLNIEEKKPREELAAARMNPARGGFSGAARRGGYSRADVRSNSSDEGRTY